MKRIIIIAAAVVLAFASCSKFTDNLNSQLNNPNSPTLAAADVDLYLGNLELSFDGFYEGATGVAEPLMRMQTMFGPTYYNAYTPSSFDGIWSNAYTGIFKTANTMIPIAEGKSEFVHAGIAKVLKAYTMITLVDLFGDVPYTQANLGVANTNPAVDKGAVVYDSAIALLDGAIAEFAKTSLVKPANDLFYGGNATNWTTFAKTLKLKAYMQTRLVDQANVTSQVTSLISANDLVTTTAQDFTFNFSTHNAAPDSRDGHYVGNYGTDAGAGDYFGNQYLYSLDVEKGFADPRTRYYIYRQLDNVTTDPRTSDQTTLQFALACYYRADPYPSGVPYCIVNNGYWGRDHGNNEGIGPDGGLRSTWGLYPAAGEFDADQNLPVGQSAGRSVGAKGDGIDPIWLSSFTYFLEAEAALTLGTAGDPLALTLNGIKQSFSKVQGFAGVVGYTIPTTDTNKIMTPYSQQKYLNKVTSLYNAATTTDDKLNVIIKEYWLAAFGNGVEPYNNYRRTGKPANMQRTLLPNEGSFIRSFFYPDIYVNFNKNAVQKTVTTVQVFWDTNPADFIH